MCYDSLLCCCFQDSHLGSNFRLLCVNVGLSEIILLGVHSVSWMYRFMFFTKSGKFWPSFHQVFFLPLSLPPFLSGTLIMQMLFYLMVSSGLFQALFTLLHFFFSFCSSDMIISFVLFRVTESFFCLLTFDAKYLF